MPAWRAALPVSLPRRVLPRRGVLRSVVAIDRFEHRGVAVRRQVRREQVGEHDGTGQVGDVLAADHPTAVRLAYDHIVVSAMRPSCPINAHTYLLPSLKRRCSAGLSLRELGQPGLHLRGGRVDHRAAVREK